LGLATLVRSRDNLQAERVNAFLKALQPVVAIAISAVFRPVSAHIDMLVNRLSTAKFHLESLIADCQVVLKRAFALLNFSPDINKFLKFGLLVDFQKRAVNKIIENPSRFSFSNSMIWNSAVTGVQSEMEVELPWLRELVLAINLAPTIAQTPDLVADICPNVPVTAVAFILHRFVPDSNVPLPLDTFRFMEKFKIFGHPESVVMPEPELVGFDEIGDIDIDLWNVRNLSMRIRKAFPYLSDYLRMQKFR
jgi:hypothetical protein